MSEPASKTFYLETFGCQMNAHDSEKVVGTLLQRGYRQVPAVRRPTHSQKTRMCGAPGLLRSG